MRIFTIIIIAFLVGCASIKPTAHNQNIKAFALSAREISTAPGTLYRDISDFRYDLRLIETSVAFSPSLVMSRLNKMADEKLQFDENVNRINDAARIINSYAECLLALTDYSERDWKKQSDELSLKLRSAMNTYNKVNPTIPPSIGDFIGGIVSKIGYVKIRKLQKKYLKSFIDSGALIINSVCSFYLETTSASLENEISTLDGQFEGIMKTFYDKLKDYQEAMKANNPFDYYKYYNSLYLDMRQRLNSLHSLDKKTMMSIKKLQTAHEKLKAAVDANMTDDLLPEIKELYSTSNEVKDDYAKFKKT